MPVRQLNSVVLPAPFGPDQARDLAGPGLQAGPVERDDAAEADGDLIDDEPGPFGGRRRVGEHRAVRRGRSVRCESVALPGPHVPQVVVLSCSNRATRGRH